MSRSAKRSNILIPVKAASISGSALSGEGTSLLVPGRGSRWLGLGSTTFNRPCPLPRRYVVA
jgi:hypothetical protein